MKLHERPAHIRSRDDLVVFICALRENLLTHSAEWENATLESFLAAMASFVEDMDGYYRNTGQEIPQQPSWKVVADMLMAATMYE